MNKIADSDAMSELLVELEARDSRVDEGGGRARQDRHRRMGRMTARERISALVDEGSFVEMGRHVTHRHSAASEMLAANVHPGDGTICGVGTIGGSNVAVYAQDPTVLRGALGLEAAKKVCRLLDLARERNFPVVSLVDCDGVRVLEGVDAFDAFGGVIRRTVQLSRGETPVTQITLVCGLAVGAAGYCAALTDWVGMVDGQSFMFVTGPKVTKVATGEDVDISDLGGAQMHATKTGAAHYVAKDDAEGIAWVRKLISFLAPPPAAEDPIDRETTELLKLVPTAPRRAYDMRKVIAAIADRDSTLELSATYAPNLLTTLGRIGGKAVAFVANQPMVLAGCLDVNSSLKGSHFVSWAARTGIPIVTLVDVPGYLPGRKQEEGGILTHGSKLLTAYSDAYGKVPLVCLVVKKCFGGASVLSWAADIRLAFPTARIGPMSGDAALEIEMGPENAEATEEEKTAREARRAELGALHETPWTPAESGYIDQVIRPDRARQTIASALARLTHSPRHP